MQIIKKLEKAIAKTKSHLLMKAKKNGLYENFGDNEIRKLEDKFINSSCYSEEMQLARKLILNFDNWCSTLCDQDLTN
jgi:hypothetical protein